MGARAWASHSHKPLWSVRLFTRSCCWHLAPASQCDQLRQLSQNRGVPGTQDFEFKNWESSGRVGMSWSPNCLPCCGILQERLPPSDWGRGGADGGSGWCPGTGTNLKDPGQEETRSLQREFLGLPRSSEAHFPSCLCGGVLRPVLPSSLVALFKAFELFITWTLYK